ncbi:MAG TPA: S1 family peptidase [Pseudonocardiaceae bacterium]
MTRGRHLVRALAVGAALAAVALAVPGTSGADPARADRGADTTKAQRELMLHSMQRDLGVSRAEAERQIVAQKTARDLDVALRTKLGGDFAGDWYDSRTGKLVVAVSNARRAAEVRAAGADARVVKHSAARLDGIRAELDRAAATDKATTSGLTAWHVDPQRNAVVVTALGTAGTSGQRAATPSALADALSRHGDAVQVEHTDVRPTTTWDYLDGGDPIGGCSVGFNAWAGSDRFVLVAGHCGVSGNYQYGNGGQLIGPFSGSSFPVNDFGLVRVTNTAYWAQGPWVDAYNGGFYNVNFWYWSAPPPGVFVCKSGKTTGLTCGTVRASNETVNTDRGTIYQMTRHTACQERGDSGGSNISWDGNGKTYAEGLSSSASLLADGRCRSKAGLENYSWFQPVGEAISIYGVNLYTTP